MTKILFRIVPTNYLELNDNQNVDVQFFDENGANIENLTALKKQIDTESKVKLFILDNLNLFNIQELIQQNESTSEVDSEK